MSRIRFLLLGFGRQFEGGVHLVVINAFCGPVSLINEDGELGTGKFLRLRDLVQGKRESLERHDDNLRLVLDGFRKLLGLGRASPLTALVKADMGDKADGLLQLLDGTVNIGIEADAVRHDNDAGELPFPIRLTHPDKLVGNPGNRAGLAGTGRMLNQVFLTDAESPDIGRRLGDAIPLMETREDLALHSPKTASGILLLLFLFIDEIVEDAQPVLLLTDVVPEIAGRILRVARLHRDVAGMAVIAFVKRQEPRLIARQVGTHPNLAFRDGEMDHRTTLVEQEIILPVRHRLNRLALSLVLLNGIIDCLSKFGLDLGRCNGDAVDEENEVERLVAGGLVMDLVHHAKDVLVVEQFLLRKTRIIRVVPGAGNRAVTGHLEALAENLDSSLVLKGLHKSQTKVRLPVGPQVRLHLVNLLRSGSLQVSDEVGHVQGRGSVKSGVVRTDHPALTVSGQIGNLLRDITLERRFLV